jgi:hypothetical protein
VAGRQQRIAWNGRPEWIRTIDLFRVNVPRTWKQRT